MPTWEACIRGSAEGGGMQSPESRQHERFGEAPQAYFTFQPIVPRNGARHANLDCAGL
jgi:hypothetical protein